MAVCVAPMLHNIYFEKVFLSNQMAGCVATMLHNIFIEREFYIKSKAWVFRINDREYIKSLMVQVTEVNKTAGWIASPSRGINKLDTVYEYVELSK